MTSCEALFEDPAPLRGQTKWWDVIWVTGVHRARGDHPLWPDSCECTWFSHVGRMNGDLDRAPDGLTRPC